jgi:plastocyanin
VKRLLAAGTLVLCTVPAVAQPPHAAGKMLHIDIENVSFGQAPKGARVGDVIQWASKDIVDHTATARDGSFDVIIPAGRSARTVLSKAGLVAFYCRYHPNMTGELSVAP